MRHIRYQPWSAREDLEAPGYPERGESLPCGRRVECGAECDRDGRQRAGGVLGLVARAGNLERAQMPRRTVVVDDGHSVRGSHLPRNHIPCVAVARIGVRTHAHQPRADLGRTLGEDTVDCCGARPEYGDPPGADDVGLVPRDPLHRGSEVLGVVETDRGDDRHVRLGHTR